MPRYQLVKVNDYDKGLGLVVGDIVTAAESQINNKIKVCKLPIRLRGKGHGHDGNYWCFSHYDVKQIPSNIVVSDCRRGE